MKDKVQAPDPRANRNSFPSNRSFDEEMWRRAEDRREASLHLDATEDERLLLPLVLSLARLAAQRDAMVSV